MSSNLILLQPIPLDEHPVAVYLASLNTTDGRRTMRQALDTMAEVLMGSPDAIVCNWSAVRFQHVMAIRAYLMEHYAPATVNKFLSALRGVLKAAWLLGQMSAEDFQKAISVDSVRNYSLPSGREVSVDEIARLLAVCNQDDTVAGIRDLAIFSVLFTTGLRRSELVLLDISDYSQQAMRLLVRGKGRKERYAWLNQQTQHYLKKWIAERHINQPALFQAISRGKNVLPRRLTSQAIYYILKKRSEEADIADFSPHDLRRTFVSTLLNAGVDIVTVSEMVGHANIQTTARYDRRGDARKQMAAEKILLPTGSLLANSSDDSD